MKSSARIIPPIAALPARWAPGVLGLCLAFLNGASSIEAGSLHEKDVCTISVEEISPVFRSESPNYPEFSVTVRNTGDWPIPYSDLLNARRIEVDGEAVGHGGIIVSGMPSSICAGSLGFDHILISEFRHKPLDSGEHVLVYLCGDVRSMPVHFWWSAKRASNSTDPSKVTGDKSN